MSEFSEDSIESEKRRAASVEDLGFSDIDGECIVTARGTEDGLVLRIDGKAPWDAILAEIDSFLGGKKRFFQGGEVSIEWLEQLPTREQGAALEQCLKENFGMKITSRRKKLGRFLKTATSGLSRNESSVTRSDEGDGEDDELLSFPPSANDIETLLERVERIAAGVETDNGVADARASRRGFPTPFSAAGDISQSDHSENGFVERITEILGTELLADEEANGRIVFGTLRSGQRVETPFSLIVIGDVNPGADLIAGGDIIVVGSLRGTAHAGAYDDEADHRLIFALQMQPMQLRIGSIVSRGVSEVGKTPEVARIDSRTILVEPFKAKSFSSRKLRF